MERKAAKVRKGERKTLEKAIKRIAKIDRRAAREAARTGRADALVAWGAKTDRDTTGDGGSHGRVDAVPFADEGSGRRGTGGQKRAREVTGRSGSAAIDAGGVLEEVAGLVRQATEPAASRIVQRVARRSRIAHEAVPVDVEAEAPDAVEREPTAVPAFEVAEVEVQAEVDAVTAEPEAEVVTEVEPEPGEPEPEPGATAEPEAEVVTEVESQPGEPEADVVAEVEPEADGPEPEPEAAATEVEPEPEPGPAPEIEPAVPEPMPGPVAIEPVPEPADSVPWPIGDDLTARPIAVALMPGARLAAQPGAGAAAIVVPAIVVPPGTVVGAAIDIGSTSVHLLVAAVGDHRVEPLLDESVFLGLGDRVAADGYLGTAARESLVEVLATYVETARRLGAQDVTLIGTEPLRRAEDGVAIVHAVEARTGVALHVLDHDEEGMLTLLGVTMGRALHSELLVLDIGGGSTELVFVGESGPVRVAGLRLGAAAPDPGPRPRRPADPRRDGSHARSGPPPGRRRSDGSTRRRRRRGRDRLQPAQAAAGNGPRPDADAAPDHRRARDAGRRAERGRRRHATSSGPERARILPAGAIIVDTILEHYGLDRLRVSEGGMREGAVLAAAKAGAAWRDRLPVLVHGWEDEGSRRSEVRPAWAEERSPDDPGPPIEARGCRRGSNRLARLEPRDQPPHRAPEGEARDAAPRRADGPSQAGELALPVHQVPADRRALALGQVAGVLHEERAGEARRDVRVVQPAQVVLEGDDLLDDRARLAPERLADELQRVAQPLGGDPEVVERGHVGPAHDRLVGAQDLVGGPDPGRHRVAHAVRLHGSDGAGPEALGLEERDVPVDPPAVALRVELLDQDDPRGVAPDPPRGDERLERRGLGGGLAVPVAPRRPRSGRPGPARRRGPPRPP